MIQDEVTKLLNGELDDAKVTELTSKLSEDAKKSLSEAIGLRKERNLTQAQLKEESEKLEKTRKELKESEDGLSSTKAATSQFRTEQISKAKAKFFADKSIKPENQAEYESMFSKIDSGKIDPDLIYRDFTKAHAAINADSFEQSKATEDELKRQAEAATAAAAGRQQSAPPGKEPKKFSDEAEKLAKSAGISAEAAERQITQGNRRTRDF